MEELIQTATIFRTWVEIAATLGSDSDRGKFYDAICRYALFGEEPNLDPLLNSFFILIRPSVDKSQKRKNAQQAGLRNRQKNRLKNEEPEKSKEQKSFVSLLPQKLNTPEMQEKWLEWEAFRRQRKPAISEFAAKSQMKALAALDVEEAMDAIDHSIANDYQGIFPDRIKKQKQKQKDYNGI